jgi:hypothetical protein
MCRADEFVTMRVPGKGGRAGIAELLPPGAARLTVDDVVGGPGRATAELGATPGRTPGSRHPMITRPNRIRISIRRAMDNLIVS